MINHTNNQNTNKGDSMNNLPQKLITLTKVKIPTDHSMNFKEYWFVELINGLDIDDLSNGVDFEDQLKIARDEAKKHNCQVKINH